MICVADPVGRERTMTKEQGKAEIIDLQAVLERDADFSSGRRCARWCRRRWKRR